MEGVHGGGGGDFPAVRVQAPVVGRARRRVDPEDSTRRRDGLINSIILD